MYECRTYICGPRHHLGLRGAVLEGRYSRSRTAAKEFQQIVQKMEAEQTAPRNRSPAERRVAQNMAAADEARAMLFGPKTTGAEEDKP